MRDIQHATNLVPEVSLTNLPHHRMNPTKHTELKRQVDELPLEVKQQCLVPIDVHSTRTSFGVMPWQGMWVRLRMLHL